MQVSPRLPGEVHGGVSLRLVRSQCIIDILQVIEVGELRDPTGQHLDTQTHTHTQIDTFNFLVGSFSRCCIYSIM